MNDLVSIIRPFNLEVLVCIVMLLSMAVGILCIAGYRLVAAMLSRMRLLTAWSKTSGPAREHSALTPDVPSHGNYM
jgi:hypothetical protein